MSEKPKPKDRPSDISSIRNGVVKDKPAIDKTAILPPPSTKPKK